MSSVGINAEAGGTAMTQTMTAISKAVSAGGDDLETFAKIAGVSASEFADMWGNEPIDAISAFIGGLGKMERTRSPYWMNWGSPGFASPICFVR